MSTSDAQAIYRALDRDTQVTIERYEDTWGDDAGWSATLLAAAIDAGFNPPDGDGALAAILAESVLKAAAFIASLPCECADPEENEPCPRCVALGRSGDVREER